MLFKLSIKNIKKSIKDYSIYFFTLVFAVAIFYMFNSIDAQSSMMVLSKSKYEIIETVVLLINYVSVLVSIILGFLIIYSNNFLIKRRKKEIGLYYTLGMSKTKVSFILVLETIFIGLISLCVGLALGICLSQFLSVVTASLFEADMTAYKFIFSSSAFTKTIMYFAIIYVLVILFNTFVLSRYKLIDLLHASKKNEKIKNKNKYVTLISFILSLASLGYAYYLLFDGALLMMDNKTVYMLVLGALGTFLLFFSLSGFILNVFQKVKNVYYKDLNIFVLRQVNNKINTSVVSTTVICLMLLLTIGSLSGSMSLAKAFNNDIEENNLTDYTIKLYAQTMYYPDVDGNEEIFITAFERFEDFYYNSDFKDKYSSDSVMIHRYGDENLLVKDMLYQKDIDHLTKEYGTNMVFNYSVPVISESEYKELMEVINKEYIDIDENEYLLLVNIDFISEAYSDFYESKDGIVLSGKKLVPATDEIIKTAVENYTSAGNDGILVVSDSLVSNLELVSMDIIGNYNNKNYDEEYEEEFDQYLTCNMNVAFDLRSRTAMEDNSIGLKSMLIFIGLYLGITFAISSATVLAIGQLSQSSDNKERYKVLKQIGADKKLINKALFTQIAITFMFPLVVALIHSYFGLREINSLIISIGNIDLTSNIIITTIFMIIVYGGYFLLTYICSKNIIKEG